MGDSLSFTGVFRAVTCVEEASLNGDEGVIVVAIVTCLGQLWIISRERVVKSSVGVRRMLWRLSVLITSLAILPCDCRRPVSLLDRQRRRDQAECGPRGQGFCELGRRLDSVFPACIDRVAIGC